MKGRRSTPGRYFQVAEPGTAWGGTNIEDPLSILGPSIRRTAWPGLRLLMVSTTGEHSAYFELDDELRTRRKRIARGVSRIRRAHSRKLRARALHRPFHGRRRRIAARRRHRKSCQPHTLCSRRAHSRHLRRCARVRLARRRHYLHGRRKPHARKRFRLCPTPALVAPIEFTLKLADYAALGGYMDHVRPLEFRPARCRMAAARWLRSDNPWPLDSHAKNAEARGCRPADPHSSRSAAPAHERRPNRLDRRSLR